MDEKRSYVRKSLHSTVTVFDRDTKEYIGLLADFSEDGVLVTSSVKPIPVGRTFHYMVLVPSNKNGGTCRAEFDATSIWSDCANETFYGTGFKLVHPSPDAQAILNRTFKAKA